MRAQRVVATALQAAYRRVVVLRRHAAHAAAATAIAAAFRGSVARRHLRRSTVAVTTIASVMRMHVLRRAFVAQRSAAVRVQATWRRVAAQTALQRSRAAVTTIAAAYRGFIVRKECARAQHAAVRVQTTWRRVTAQRALREAVRAATVIAATARMYAARRTVRAQRVVATALQAAYRRHRAQRSYAKQLAAIVLIQSFSRMLPAQRLARDRREAGACIRAAVSMAVARTRFVQMRKAAVTIQCRFRFCMAQALTRGCAIAVQTAWRGFLARQLYRRTLAAVAIQRCVKSVFAARLAHLRGVHAVCVMQSRFRARLVRAKAAARVAAVRRRIAEANSRATPANTLWARTSAALEQLSRSTRLTVVMQACRTVELSTRFSPVCCMMFAERGIVPAIYALIRSCNRSQPHQELLRLALGVLVNTAKHPVSQPAVASASECVDVLVDLLQMFRDTATVFAPALWLLRTVCRVSAERQASVAGNDDVMRRLTSLHHILSRRQAVLAKQDVRRPAAAKEARALAKALHGMEALLHMLRK